MCCGSLVITEGLDTCTGSAWNLGLREVFAQVCAATFLCGREKNKWKVAQVII